MMSIQAFVCSVLLCSASARAAPHDFSCERSRAATFHRAQPQRLPVAARDVEGPGSWRVVVALAADQRIGWGSLVTMALAASPWSIVDVARDVCAVAGALVGQRWSALGPVTITLHR